MTYSMNKCARLVGLALVTGIALSAPPALSDEMGMKMSNPKAMSATTGYRFELAGPPKSAGSGKSIVSVKLMHDGKPVSGAIIIQSRADMGPMGMAAHTAPIKALGEKPPGTYSFEIDNGPVWKKPDDWAVTFHAKVQGVAQTVTGSVTVKLQP
ncbi:MAG TPA: FixH family protein [Rhizomicrobium sp.]|nr:FixH family protein [Rhizomicrobium sp.]